MVMAVALAACSTVSPETGESISVPELPTTSSSRPEPVPTTLPSSTSSPPTAPATTAPGTTDPPAPESETMAVEDLGSPILAYGYADREELVVIEREGQRALMSGRVEAVRPDGRDGLLAQTEEGAIEWVPDLTSDTSITLAREEEILLRGTLPDGRALYSLRPPVDETSDSSVERFFAVELAQGSEPEEVATAPALESWIVGPAFTADSEPVHAACHLHCSLWPGLAEAGQGSDPLYHGGGGVAPATGIDGLAATRDGRLVGFVEYDPVLDGGVRLVVLDGATFEVVSRQPLPVDGDDPIDRATVSLSADGQRILVGLSGPARPPTSHLISGALTDSPRLSRLDIDAHLAWLDPVAAAAQGGRATEGERRVADRLLAFARSPEASNFARLPLSDEVGLALGPDLVEQTMSDRLADPTAWSLPGPFRAHTGPFSAIELLARADEPHVTAGPHAHCAAPPVPAPEEVSDLSRVSLQPAHPQSCLEWWTVDLFLTDAGEIAAISLDVWEP